MKIFFMFLICIFSISISYAESTQYPNNIADVQPNVQLWNRDPWNHGYISFPSSFSQQWHIHTEQEIQTWSKIPNTDSVLDALTVALFWEKTTHSLALTNARRTNTDLHTTIDILWSHLRFEHDMDWWEYPETLASTHQMVFNTQINDQYSLHVPQAGKYTMQLYPINWNKTNISLSSPVRTIEKPLFVFTDPVLDWQIQWISLQNNTSSLTQNISNITRKYKKELLDTHAWNITIPMDTQELSNIQKEFFSGTGTMEKAVQMINQQPRRDVYMISPYYEMELDIPTPWEYTLEMITQVYREPKPEHWLDELR